MITALEALSRVLDNSVEFEKICAAIYEAADKGENKIEFYFKSRDDRYRNQIAYYFTKLDYEVHLFVDFILIIW